MHLHTPLTLAANWTDFIWVAIALFVFISSAIGNMKKSKQKEQQAAAHRAAARRASSSSASSNVPSLDELAARRRQQLQEMAQQRRAAQSRSAPLAPRTQPLDPIVPEKMSATEAQQHRLARVELDRRAQVLRAQHRQAEMDARQRTEAARRQAQEAAMERQRHARRADVQRAPQTRAQQQQQQRAAQRRVQPARQAPPRRVGGVSSALGEGVTVVDSGPVHHMDIGESLVHRHVTDAPVPKVKLPGMGHLHLNAHTLRQAIVLKEILDPPVSMRQPVV